MDLARQQRNRMAMAAWGMLAAGMTIGQHAAGQTKKPALPIEIQDVNGVKVRPLDTKNRRASVFVFIMHDCPIANSYAPELNAIYKEYAPKNVNLSVVYVEDDLSRTAAKRHARAYGYQFSALRDPKHLLVRKLRATVTPEAVVLGPDGKTVYQGRINDQYVDFGKRRHQATVNDLRDALDATLAGRPVAAAKTKAIGCFIPEISSR